MPDDSRPAITIPPADGRSFTVAAGETFRVPLMTWETVVWETPAALATSCIVTITAPLSRSL